MDLRQMVLANRSYRRFDAAHRIDMAVLEELVALARCTPSAGNCQPLKYVLCTSPECAARIFDTLAWAAYLADWPGPGSLGEAHGLHRACCGTQRSSRGDPRSTWASRRRPSSWAPPKKAWAGAWS